MKHLAHSWTYVSYVELCVRALLDHPHHHGHSATVTAMDLDPLQAEPPTRGSLRFHTVQGPIDIELWGKEAPKACRNIVQLSLEGFYDGLPFHRFVADFIVQTGDPTGTGRGGTSIYAPLLPDGSAPDGRDLSHSDEGYFSDEFHPRLRFNKRGMLGMANANAANTNQSQFFITLAPAPELQGKHTLFGRVAGASMYTLLALLEGVEADDDGHPIPKDKAPRINRVEVVDNPFDDLVPRVSQASRRAEQEQARARAKAQRKVQRKAEEKAQLKAQTKKRKVLLSFGDEEEDQDVPSAAKGKKAKSQATRQEPLKLDKSRLAAPGLVDAPDPSRSSSRSPTAPVEQESSSPVRSASIETPAPHLLPAPLSPPRPGVPTQDPEGIEAKLLGRNPEHGAHPTLPVEEQESKKSKRRESAGAGRTWLAEQKAHYSKSRPKDVDVLARLNSFRNKLKRADESDARQAPADHNVEDDVELDPDMREYGSSSDEERHTGKRSRTGWAELLGHKFEDTKHGAVRDRLQADDYAVLDPRGEEGDNGKVGAADLTGAKDTASLRAREEKHRHAWARQVQEDEDVEAMRRNEERRYAERSGMTWGRSAPSRPPTDSRGPRDLPPPPRSRGERDESFGYQRSGRPPTRESVPLRRGPRPDRQREFGRPSHYGGRRGDDLDRRAPSRSNQ